MAGCGLVSELLRPKSIEEVQNLIRHSQHLWLMDDQELAETAGTTFSLEKLTGIIDFQPADQVVAVRAGAGLADLQQVLSAANQSLPAIESARSIGSLYMDDRIAGTIRDIVLGATFILADGTIAKSGSSAVKNVAGYDVHKFMAGTRSSLAICVELILRTSPGEPIAAQASQEMRPITETTARFMKRAKHVFDPSGKLNPGIWGFM